MKDIFFRVVFVLCLLMYIETTSIRDSFSNWRPSFQISAENVHKGNGRDPLKLVKSGRFQRLSDVADFTRTALRRSSSEIHSTLEELLSSGDDLADAGPILGRHDYCDPLKSDPDSALDSLDNLDVILNENNTRCSLCTGVFGILQNLACAAEDDNLAHALILICERIFNDTGVSNPAMCNGTITMQAPFVFTTLRESTPYDFCETLNMCYPPPKPSQTSVRDKIQHMLYPTNPTGLRRPVGTKRRRRQADEIKVLQLADIHMSTVYAEGSAVDCGMYVCCLEEFSGDGKARMYGEYACNIPERTIRHVLDAARHLGPDFAIYTGDSPPHTIWDETLQSQLNCTNIVLNILKNEFPGLTIFPAIGNHEMFPTNIYTLDGRYNHTKEMNHVFANLWQNVTGFGADQMETMQRMGYYTMRVPNHDKLRILTFNTNHYWYSLNFMAPLNRNSTNEEVQRQFIRDTLSQARADDEKVIVVAHHPVTSPDSTVRATRWWEERVLEFSDVIIMQLSGHTHSDEFHLFTDPASGQAKAINYVAPSLTSNTDVNPSFRMFYLDSASYDVINYINYHADIETQDIDVPPPVVENYDVKTLYGLQDLTPESWKELSISFVSDTELFQAWYNNKHAGALDETCTGECQKTHICSMWFPNYDEVDACVLNWDDYVQIDVAHHITPAFNLVIVAIIVEQMLANID